MTETQIIKQYNLEERTQEFARRSRAFVRQLSRTITNLSDGPQLVRASGSVAANYIEANESLSKKDFVMRIKISRKESKECRLWLNLIDIGEMRDLLSERQALIKEATELMNIFGSIIRKIEN
jgi:four helix bundle protein